MGGNPINMTDPLGAEETAVTGGGESESTGSSKSESSGGSSSGGSSSGGGSPDFDGFADHINSLKQGSSSGEILPEVQRHMESVSDNSELKPTPEKTGARKFFDTWKKANESGMVDAIKPGFGFISTSLYESFDAVNVTLDNLADVFGIINRPAMHLDGEISSQQEIQDAGVEVMSMFVFSMASKLMGGGGIKSIDDFITNYKWTFKNGKNQTTIFDDIPKLENRLQKISVNSKIYPNGTKVFHFKNGSKASIYPKRTSTGVPGLHIIHSNGSIYKANLINITK